MIMMKNTARPTPTPIVPSPFKDQVDGFVGLEAAVGVARGGFGASVGRLRLALRCWRYIADELTVG